MLRLVCRLLMLISLLAITVSPAMASQAFTLDPNHTYVLWHINHLGFSMQSGKWMAQGNLLLDKDNLKNSKVNVTINVADMITGNPELDKHLKDKLFFDVDKYPTATFVSEKVDVTGKKTAKIKGVLTLHGISKPVTLDVKFNNAGKNPVTGKDTVGFSATTSINRSDFDIMTLLPELGDKVVLNIEVEAYSAA